jgi:peptidyl-prolyl cis-trans isomerase SurA
MMPIFHSCLPIRKSLVAAALALALLGQPDAWAQRAVAVDRVVAVVNNEVITAVELRDRVNLALQQLARQNVQPPAREVLERQVLERLIIENVQLQLARDTGLSVDETTLNRAVARVAQGNGMDEAQLREVVEGDGMSWNAFREQIRREIMMSRLREREVDSRIVVTEAEIDQFIASNSEAFSGREFLMAHILLRVPENPTQAQLTELDGKAREIMQRLQAGEDFAQLAVTYSDAPDATNGGVIGWRSMDRLPALFAEAAQNMQPGQVSPVLRSAAGLHIVMFVDQRGGELAVPTEAMQTRARHILLRTSEVIDDQEAQARLLGLRERILNGESFADLARAHSADLTSARGGELGWLNPGDTVPEFERAMDALAAGEISEPVKSPFGWHLIMVEERRVQDISADAKRNAARAALRERKGEELMGNWLQELRDRAFVQYRMELE